MDDIKDCKPLGNRVIVERDEPEKQSKGGIIIPASAGHERIQTGTVIAVGPGKVDKTGELVPPPLKVGDRIVWDGFNGGEFKLNDRTYFFIEAGNIHGVLED